LTETFKLQATVKFVERVAMSKAVALLLILITLTATSTTITKPALSSAEKLEENIWTTKASMPEAISGVKAAVVNGKIYVLGDWINYEYDPATDNWTAKKPMPTPRTGSFGVAACENKIYVMGGQDENLSSRGYYFLSINEVYDTQTDSWENKKPMPTNREYFDLNVINGKIYAIGGHSYASDNRYPSDYSGVNEVYDPATDSWETKHPAPLAIARYASAVVNNEIYVMGGTSQIYNDSMKWVSNQIYNVETDTWRLGASLPTPAIYSSAVATTGAMAPKRIYVMGGGFTEVNNAVNIYDPAVDNWTAGSPMPTSRSSLATGVVNDIIYAIGGSRGWEGGEWPFSGHAVGATNVVEQYIPFGYGTIQQESETEPFPTMLVVTASGASAIAIGAGLLVYFKKHKHKAESE
jgi:N-acetylneuraminic acid mutarotase